MIDIKHLLQNRELYNQELKKRFKVDENLVNRLADNYIDLVKIQKELDLLRQEKNEFNLAISKLSLDEKTKGLAKMKEVSLVIKNLESKISSLKELCQKDIYLIPNLSNGLTPVGKDSEANKVIKTKGDKQAFNFEVKNYYDLPIFKRDYLGQKGVEAFGTRGYYIKGELAKLQKALFEYVAQQLEDEGFEYVICPIMVNENTLYGTGFFPSGIEDTYSVKSGDKTFYLVGTSEAPLMFLNSNTTLDLLKPIMLTAQTPCFRKEAGSYGKDVAGGIRVHQFDKIETIIICKKEDSENMFEKILDVATKNIEKLNLSYQHLEVSTGDMSLKNHRQVDIEAWFPAQQQYRELCSASNCTDYQTRTLNTLYIDEKTGEKVQAHSLNCTGVVNRTLFAILEQNQQADGSIVLPLVLAEKLGKSILF